MKATDLMLGDWVCVAKNFAQKYHRVRALSNDENDVVKGIYINDYGVECNSIFSCNDIEPIPLTPEILEKNGFVKINTIYNGLSYQYFDKDKRNKVIVSFHEGDDITNIEIDSQLCWLNSDFSFLHQLQHALKLCGVKKEIEL